MEDAVSVSRLYKKLIHKSPYYKGFFSDEDGFEPTEDELHNIDFMEFFNQGREDRLRQDLMKALTNTGDNK